MVPYRGARHEGIDGIEPRRNLQITPYVISRLDVTEADDEPGRSATDASMDAGVDLKLGLGSAFTINATINPDFGQVESDPAELNLTAFETTFPEARPFFVEGSQIYNFEAGPANLVYTRRIGAQGPIIGAAKISGRTAGGLSVGLLGATTGERFDPERHYGVARVSQEIGAFSSAGGVVTVYDSLTSLGRRRTFSGGVDMDLRSPGNRYDLQGFAAFTSRQLLDAADQSGFAAMLRAGKRQGALTFYALADAYHHGFNPVDVGQLRNGDFYTLTASTSFQLNGGQPFGPFQRGNVGLNVRQQWTFEDRLDRGFNIGWNSRWTLRGFQTFFLSGGTTMSGYDPSQTRGLGPRLNPREVRWQSGFSTDDRKSWRLSADFNVNLDEYGGRRLGTGLGTRWNVSSRFTLSGNVRGDWEHTEVDWSSNETFRFGDKGWEIGTEASAPSSLEDHEFVRVQDQAAIAAILSGMAPYDGSGRYYIPVFGVRNSRTLDTTIHSSFTFTRHLDFSFYGQLFLARARYDDFQLLRDKDTHVPFPGYPKGNEFARNRFQFNSVLRWEYRPGSTVFVVWSQGRSGDDRLDPLLPIGRSPYDTPLSTQVGDTFGLLPQNVFLIKINYAFLN